MQYFGSENQDNVKKLGAEKLPQHVAIIMDGNGRWAKKQFRPRIWGHHRGVERAREIIEYCCRLNIPKLSLYAFSEENWSRPFEEVSALMGILNTYIRREFKKLNENNIRLRVIGDLERIPKSTRLALEEAISKLSTNTGMILTLALSYGSQSEIVDAAKQIASDVLHGRMTLDEICKDSFSRRLQSFELGSIDLLIRTSGEFRISNFMLWQLAYAELHFSSILWPDFTIKHFDEALIEFSKRQRRFGGVVEDPILSQGTDHKLSLGPSDPIKAHLAGAPSKLV